IGVAVARPAADLLLVRLLLRGQRWLEVAPVVQPDRTGELARAGHRWRWPPARLRQVPLQLRDRLLGALPLLIRHLPLPGVLGHGTSSITMIHFWRSGSQVRLVTMKLV